MYYTFTLSELYSTLRFTTELERLTQTTYAAHDLMRLVSRGLVLLLITTNFERLATLDRVHVDLLAGTALEAKDNLLRGLSL